MPFTLKQPMKVKDPIEDEVADPYTTFETDGKWIVQKEGGVEVDRAPFVSPLRARVWANLITDWKNRGTLPIEALP